MPTLALRRFLHGVSFVLALMATSANAPAFAQADEAAKAGPRESGAESRGSPPSQHATRSADLHSQIEVGPAGSTYSLRASAFDSSRPHVVIWISVSEPELIPPGALQNVQIFSKEGRTIRYRDENRRLPYLIGSGSQFGGGDTLVARYRLRRGSDYAKLDRVSFTYRDKDYDIKLLPMLAVPLEMNYLEHPALWPPPLAPGGTRQLRRPRSTNSQVAS